MRRFIIPFVAVLGAFILSTITTFLWAGHVGVWNTLVTGIVAAPTVVAVCYATSAKRKRLSATIAYLVGAAAAAYLLKHEEYPESYARAYEPTLLPLFATLISGALALLALVVIRKKQNKTTPPSPRPAFRVPK